MVFLRPEVVTFYASRVLPEIRGLHGFALLTEAERVNAVRVLKESRIPGVIVDILPAAVGPPAGDQLHFSFEDVFEMGSRARSARFLS